MSSACAPILVGMTFLVSEILLPSKTANFPFPTMDYSPWSSTNLINRNRFKKFMQVRIDVKCMCTNFGGCDLFGFGDTTTFKNGQFSLSDHGLQVITRHLWCVVSPPIIHKTMHFMHNNYYGIIIIILKF